jgi:hypothetical protein
MRRQKPWGTGHRLIFPPTSKQGTAPVPRRSEARFPLGSESRLKIETPRKSRFPHPGGRILRSFLRGPGFLPHARLGALDNRPRNAIRARSEPTI